MDVQFLVFCLIQFVLCAVLSIVHPFYPQRAKEAGVSLAVTGLIYSLKPIGKCAACLPTGYYLKQIGRRRGILVSLLMLSAACLLLGLAEFTSTAGFIAMNVAGMLLLGVASGMVLTIIIAIASSVYANTLRVSIMYFEIVAGLGILTGPFVGSWLFDIGGYALPYLSFSLFFGLSVPCVYFVESGQDFKQMEIATTLRPTVHSALYEQQGGLFGLLQRRVIMLDLLSYCLVMFGIGITLPTMSIHLISFGVTLEQAAVLCNAVTVCYLLSAPVVAHLPKSIDFRLTIGFGLLCSAVGYFCTGPISPLPSRLYWVVIGLGMSGVGFGSVYIPCLPNMLRNSTEHLGLQNNDTLSGALSSSMNFIAAFGEILGPMLGGILAQSCGFKMTFGLLAALVLSYLCVYCSCSSRRRPGLLTSAQEKVAMTELQSALEL
jgi:MFS family permease